MARELERLRKICLSLPETTEKIAWGEPTFRVGGRMFAMFANDHHGDGRVAVWCRAPFGVQGALVESDPVRFFVPPYVGPKGWVGVRLDRRPDWKAVADVIEDGWRMSAPNPQKVRVYLAEKGLEVPLERVEIGAEHRHLHARHERFSRRPSARA